MRYALVGFVVVALLAPFPVHAQQFTTMYDGSPTVAGAPRLPLLVGPSGNRALPCTLFGSRFMRTVPTSYCLSDTELAEERERVRSIIGNPAQKPAVVRQAKSRMVPIVAPQSAPQPHVRVAVGSRVGTATPRARIVAARMARTRNLAHAYRGGGPALSGAAASGAPMPGSAVGGTSDERSGGRSQRIP
jgi:hypothetical protein